MNARIKELIKECSSTYTSYFDGRGNVTDTHFDKEKFAELIVEECAAQCWTVSEIESRGFVVSECTKRMRKHFGVA